MYASAKHKLTIEKIRIEDYSDKITLTIEDSDKIIIMSFLFFSTRLLYLFSIY